MFFVFFVKFQFCGLRGYAFEQSIYFLGHWIWICLVVDVAPISVFEIKISRLGRGALLDVIWNIQLSIEVGGLDVKYFITLADWWTDVDLKWNTKFTLEGKEIAQVSKVEIEVFGFLIWIIALDRYKCFYLTQYTCVPLLDFRSKIFKFGICKYDLS